MPQATHREVITVSRPQLLRSRTTLGSALLLIASASCSSSIDMLTAPGASAPIRGGEPIQTDRVSYSATVLGGQGAFTRYGFRVIATYTNRTGGSMYLATCAPGDRTPAYGIVSASRVNGNVLNTSVSASADDVIGYAKAWACVGHDQQIAVPAGAAHTDTLDLAGPNAFQGGAPVGKLEGRLVIAYSASSCPGDGGCPGQVPVTLLSNPFDVAVAP